jgi:hypothetical protein
MKLLIDGDGCPRRQRQIAEKAARRKGLSIVIAADRPIPLSPGTAAEQLTAPEGSGEADDLLLGRTETGDVVITRDFPLAERLVAAGAVVLDDRGGVYDAENIAARRSERDRMMELREMGVRTEEERSRRGSTGEREVKAFADALDRVLTAMLRGGAQR